MASFLLVIILVLLGLGLAYLLWRLFWSSPHQLFLPLPEDQEEERPWYYPFSSSLRIQAQLRQQRAQHKDKAKHQKRETLLAFWGLAPKKVLLPDDFRKLLQIVKEYRQQKLLLPGQRTALERLEQLFGEKKTGPVYLPFTRKETKDVFAWLRQLSRSKNF